MIYANDQWIQLPTRDIYDTSIMMASINAAKDMYEKGVQQVKDFKKEYGDFVSPIQADMDWYNQNVTNKVQDTINSLYDAGIDPLRSQQGRATISRLINSMPTGTINKLRQSSVTAQKYLDMKAKLIADGKWNPEFENMLTGGKTLDTWSTVNDGMWERQSPGVYRDLNELTSKWFDQLEPSFLYKKGGYDWYGIRDNELNNTMRSQIPDFLNSDLGRYNMYLAKQQLLQKGVENPNNEQITAQLMDNIRNANAEKLKLTNKVNEYDLEALKFKRQIALENLKQRHARALQGSQQPTVQQPLPSWTTQKQFGSNAKYNQSVGINGDGTGDNVNFRNTVGQIVNYWKEEAARRSTSATGRQSKGYANRIASFWQRVGQQGVEYAVKNGVFKVDGNNQLLPSETLIRQINKVASGHGIATPRSVSIRNATELYNRYTTKTIPGADQTTALKELSGQGQTVKYPGGTGKYYPINMGDKTVVFSPIRKLQVAGYKPNRQSLAYKFNDWMQRRGLTGYLVNQNTTTAAIPIRGGNQMIDINGMASIPLSDLNEFAKEVGGEPVDVARSLGLTLYTKDGKVASGGKSVDRNVQYVHIPVTRMRQNDYGFNDANTNYGYDSGMFGRNTANDYATDRFSSSLGSK